ncbi:hypothetical protein BN59_02091 [Legionella massiliensis]|uniref:Uncharacterized protein n=1 Tax=Legionella massiliensis TaxID=1034943 RepID=A0A078KXW0_9GAMM|nr:hypothetical protein [Legionella massiliensis]CDZ77801.1 hypothetical protein BN59_02091 [Legionella massiliensis]CEE13539.1 hypothetical protein BN1094_02091 [Legionella massiliensis]
MKNTLISLILVSSFLPLSAQAGLDIKTYKYSFAKNEHFDVAFADYPKGQEEFYELEYKEAAQLPPEIMLKIRGLKIAGSNHSDDLFMYSYKQLKGLKPNTTYQVQFSLEFASNAASDSIGVGGGPGSSVYVKIGVVDAKPRRYLDSDNFYRIALDKGNQMTDGKDMILLGTIGVDTEDAIYRLKTLPYQPDAEMQEKLDHYTVTSNGKGEAWLVLGTDSAFESKSTLYYTNVLAHFKELLK